MWVKICGNTNLEDAQLAARLGADAVGFVFAPSPRQVTALQVAAITYHLPPHVERIGVFHSHDAAQIESIARTAGLTAVQLHGGLDESSPRQLAERFAGSVQIIQTLNWTVGAPPPHAPASPATDSPAALLATQIARIASLGLDRPHPDRLQGRRGHGRNGSGLRLGCCEVTLRLCAQRRASDSRRRPQSAECSPCYRTAQTMGC